MFLVTSLGITVILNIISSFPRLHICQISLFFKSLIIFCWVSDHLPLKKFVVKSTVFCISSSFSIWCQVNPLLKQEHGYSCPGLVPSDTEYVYLMKMVSSHTTSDFIWQDHTPCVTRDILASTSSDRPAWGWCQQVYNIHLWGLHLQPNFLLQILFPQHAKKDKYSLGLPQ